MGENVVDLQYRTVEIAPGTPLPGEIWMPYSCLITNRFIGSPTGPNDAYDLTIPALRIMTDVAAMQTRASTSTLLLEPFSNVENGASVTKSIVWKMWLDMQALPTTGRIRRVLSTLPFSTDIDLIYPQIDVDTFVQSTRNDITERLWGHYLGLPFPEKMLHSEHARSVLERLRLAEFRDGRTRFRTKYFIDALGSLDSERFDIKGRQVLLAIEQGSWDPEGKKQFMDVSFWTVDKTIGRGGMLKLLGVGITPQYIGPTLENDTRRGSWVLSWDNNARGNLVPMEKAALQVQANLQKANHLADIALKQHIRNPERRTQVGGVFAQNRGILRDELFYRGRLQRDMLFYLPTASRDVLIAPMHCDESLRDRTPIEQFEQIKRAARKNSMYGSALEFSDAGRKCLEENGIAVDTETINLFHECINPNQLQDAFRELDPADHSRWLDAYLSDDLVCLHDPFDMIRTYDKLGLFRFYRHLSQISDEEWGRIGKELENILGDESTFSRNMYTAHHAGEYGLLTQDGKPSPFDIMLHARIQQELYKNPYAAFVTAIRNARVASKTVQDIVREDRPYLEVVENLLELDLP